MNHFSSTWYQTILVALLAVVISPSQAACSAVPNVNAATARGPLDTNCADIGYMEKETRWRPAGTQRHRCNQSILSSMRRVGMGKDNLFDHDELVAAIGRDGDLVGILYPSINDRGSVHRQEGPAEDFGGNDVLAWGRWSKGQQVQLPEVIGGGKQLITTNPLTFDRSLHYVVGIETRKQYFSDLGTGALPASSTPLPCYNTGYRFVAATRPTIDGRDQDGKVVEPGRIDSAEAIVVEFDNKNSAIAKVRLRIGRVVDSLSWPLKRMPREDRPLSSGYPDRLTLGELDRGGKVKDCPEAPPPGHLCSNAYVRAYFFGRGAEYLAIVYRVPATQLLFKTAWSSSEFRYRYNTISGVLVYKRPILRAP